MPTSAKQHGRGVILCIDITEKMLKEWKENPIPIHLANFSNNIVIEMKCYRDRDETTDLIVNIRRLSINSITLKFNRRSTAHYLSCLVYLPIQDISLSEKT